MLEGTASQVAEGYLTLRQQRVHSAIFSGKGRVAADEPTCISLVDSQRTTVVAKRINTEPNQSVL